MGLQGSCPDASNGGPGSQRWENKTRLDGQPYNKLGPKQDGAHNDKIEEIIARVTADGHEHIGGGSYRNVPEMVIDTKGGIKSSRRPDASFINSRTGEEFHFNVGKSNVRAGDEIRNVDPIIREREALADLRDAGAKVYFEAYD